MIVKGIFFRAYFISVMLNQVFVFLFPLRFLHFELCSEKLTDETFRLVNFPRDDSNGLRDLGLHLARCFVDETTKLIDQKEVEGFTVDDINLEEVKRIALQVTDGLLNLGTALKTKHFP